MTEMRMAELASQSGLSVPTIKYYLREGLLPSGQRTNVNQARYDESHLERLRLIRALAKVAGLPLSAIRAVVQAVDAQSPVHEVMGITQDALVGDIEPVPGTGERGGGAEELLDGVIAKLSWTCQPGSPAHLAAIRAVAELQVEDQAAVLDRIEQFAQAADDVGRVDVEIVSEAASVEEMMRSVVVGSVLRRPLLDALVLLAQQHYAQQNARALPMTGSRIDA